MFKFRYLAATAILGVALWGAGAARAVIPEQTPQQQFSALRDQYVAQIAPLEKDAKEAWWI